MKSQPLIVLADDLTGAAEIAAIAHASGLRAIVRTSVPDAPLDADVIVCDTDSRLAPPAQAAARVRSFATKLQSWPHDGFFKKTDSVLRGNVLAEIDACLEALAFERALLVPCNPSLGRIILNGNYYISNVALHKTSFARDPHHPRRTSDVLKLVSPRGAARVTLHVPSDRLPASGIIVGEADSPADVTLWAGRVTTKTLAAGGADFFRMWLLRTRRTHRKVVPVPLEPGRAVLLSGTSAVNDPITPLPGALFTLDPTHLATPDSLAAQLDEALQQGGFASVHTGGKIHRTAATPAALTRIFVRTALELRVRGSFKHLLIAGGATAAAVLKELGWSELKVLRNWGPGVVTLQPVACPEVTVTMKPGSYAWPASLSEHFNSTAFTGHV